MSMGQTPAVLVCLGPGEGSESVSIGVSSHLLALTPATPFRTYCDLFGGLNEILND